MASFRRRHSTVNFAVLGYGDIVMQPPWRILGAMEAIRDRDILIVGLIGSNTVQYFR
ncbi:MAG: hypothetical protein WBM44_11775 [Waterburya sp.]